MTHPADMPNPLEDLLTSPDVAAMIGKSQRTTVRLTNDGVIPHAMKLPGPNGAFIYRRGDIEHYLSKRDGAKRTVA